MASKTWLELSSGGKRKAAGATEIKAAINKGNLKDAVYAQHANGYFELAPDKYLSAVVSNYNKIMNGVGWPQILTMDGITQALHKSLHKQGNSSNG